LTSSNLREINDFQLLEVENSHQCFTSITTAAAKIEEAYPFASTTSSLADTHTKITMQ